MEIMITLVILVFLILIFVAATQPVTLGLSSFELRRQEKAGILSDLDVIRANYYHQVKIFFRLVLYILLATLVILSVWILGWSNGIWFSLVAIIIFQPIANLKLIRNLAKAAYLIYERHLLSLVSKITWLLKLLETQEDLSAQRSKLKLFSKAELRSVIRTSTGLLTEPELKMVNGALKFSDKTVDDVMTTRNSIEAIDAKELLGPIVLSDLHKTGHKRFPVTDGNLDNIVGVLYVHELLTIDSSKKTPKASDAMNKSVGYVHQTYSLNQALEAALATDNSLLIVINSARETVGLITVEDILGTLFGGRVLDDESFSKHDDLAAVAKRKQNK